MKRPGVLRSALFAPDGNTLTTSSDDGTVRLWDTDAFMTSPPSPTRPARSRAGP
ncbi:WD40 repeat domain-containing protein [Streptomyces sp. NPDC051217]|uniref:WD40 repeat domain-containing protein n=1 Tax=Streptomyces sp. NPDC051217 TaxID=3365644 RepID=UPI0037A4E9F6